MEKEKGVDAVHRFPTVWEDSRTRRLADRALVRNFWEIPAVKWIASTNLVVWGADVETILSKTKKETDAMVAEP